jgi:drug/metabolite transporter (DMT)-like permease
MNLLLLLILGTIWGTSYMLIKIVLVDVGPMTLVTGRLGLAALIIWGLLRLRRTPFPRERKLWIAYAVTGLLNGALPFTLISWGELHISSGSAALLQATTPLFTILLAHALTQDERLTWRKVAGVFVGFTGVGLLMWPEVRQGVGSSALGMLAIVGSSISYALSAIFTRWRLQGQDPTTSSAGQFTMGFAYILPLAFIFEQPAAIRPSMLALAAWVTLAIVCTVVAYIIYYTLLEKTSATFATMVTYIVPVNGLILGAIFLTETLNSLVLLSLGLVLAGVLLVRHKGQPFRANAPAPLKQ